MTYFPPFWYHNLHGHCRRTGRGWCRLPFRLGFNLLNSMMQEQEVTKVPFQILQRSLFETINQYVTIKGITLFYACTCILQTTAMFFFLISGAGKWVLQHVLVKGSSRSTRTSHMLSQPSSLTCSKNQAASISTDFPFIMLIAYQVWSDTQICS